jgi:hypothetical protein
MRMPTLIVCALTVVSACSNPPISATNNTLATTHLANDATPSGDPNSVSVVSEALGQRLDQMLGTRQASSAVTH